jgi:hypothetical protein
MAHVTFIHGIANKPPSDTLLKSWLATLGDGDGPDLNALGVSSSMVYWAKFLYPRPADPALAYESAEAMGLGGVDDVDMQWLAGASGDEAASMAGLAAKIGYREAVVEEAVPPAALEPGFERVPLPWVLKRKLMKILLRDVHHYLFNTDFSPRPGEQFAIQDVIRKQVVAALHEGARYPGPHVLVTHSMGTVIAYDCLKRVKTCPPVDGLLTIGSPLGIDEIQDQLKPQWTRNDGFPGERLHGPWINVFDRLDPVAGFDPELANDFFRIGTPAVRDIHEPNYGRWRHSIAKYLAGIKLRTALEELLQL